MKLTLCSVFHNAMGDFTINGISTRADCVYMVDEAHGKTLDTSKIHPERIFKMEDCGEGYIRLVPLTNTKPQLSGPMAGGNIATLARGCTPREHPLQGKFFHIHDRYESWELTKLNYD